MKLVTFEEPFFHQERLGLLLDGSVLDLNLAYAAELQAQGEGRAAEFATALVPPRMLDFLAGGQRSMDAAHAVMRQAKEQLQQGKLMGLRGEQIVFAEGQVKIKAPVPRPGKIIHTAGNFREHAKEGAEGGWEFPIPQWISFLKSPSAVIGQDDAIVHPKFTQQLDHEIELAMVIGRRGKYIPKEQAMDYVAGFTVFNDITARDVQQAEMKNGLLNFGKNFDTFAPFGPCLALKDEIPDPHNLKIELRVNGEVRQSGHTSRLSVTLPEIIAHYSWVTLEPGDIVTTGTVSGVAAFRADRDKYWLRPGDVLESEIERIGILRNRVVAES
jgi:2-keto-4-pentenoate hydratase/2-oxohepta-3-ene-1,7-dioic acid hydratase in catechol pathway